IRDTQRCLVGSEMCIRDRVGAAEADGSLELLDVQGRRIRSWTAGASTLSWDGADRGGRRLAAGVYWLRWTAPSGQAAAVRVIRR
ncbi:MAG: hypothetical protein QUU85_05765, partial [Candidatus Eisenbacteria bacterium]|nr:hypothetical protein [Candidatus Eisenbacteria bacterium]